jgi:hypothetical protein
MHKAGGIVLLLPCDIEPGPGFIGFDMGDKFRDRSLHLVDPGRPHAVRCNGLDGHSNSPGFNADVNLQDENAGASQATKKGLSAGSGDWGWRAHSSHRYSFDY